MAQRICQIIYCSLFRGFARMIYFCWTNISVCFRSLTSPEDYNLAKRNCPHYILFIQSELCNSRFQKSCFCNQYSCLNSDYLVICIAFCNQCRILIFPSNLSISHLVLLAHASRHGQGVEGNNNNKYYFDVFKSNCMSDCRHWWLLLLILNVL